MDRDGVYKIGLVRLLGVGLVILLSFISIDYLSSLFCSIASFSWPFETERSLMVVFWTEDGTEKIRSGILSEITIIIIVAL